MEDGTKRQAEAIKKAMENLKKLDSENERLRQENKQYLELMQKVHGDYASIDLEEHKVKDFIKVMEHRYDNLEKAVKEKDEQIGLLKISLDEANNQHNDLLMRYNALEKSGFGNICEKLDIIISEGKVKECGQKIKKLKYLAAALSIGLALALGYVGYDQYNRHQDRQIVSQNK